MALSEVYPEKININSIWKFSQEGSDKWNPAEVPGCVHTDLMKNNLIPDPFFGINERSLQWIGEKNWIYKTVFDVPSNIMKKEVVELVFEGLDTYAEVTLNDSLILKTDNMFRTWRVDCKKILHTKNNHITVRFKNVFDEDLPKCKSAPFELQAFSNNDQADVKIGMYSRKAQFHYGWDWGPRLITCGIWRPVYIESWSDFKINNVHLQQKNVSEKGADLLSVIEIVSDKNQKVTAAAFINSLSVLKNDFNIKPGINKVNINVHLDNPKLWWTNGLGEQYLYDYKIKIENDSGYCDEYTSKIGIRSLEVIREKDSLGTSLFVRLNGVPVFMKGANYIPQDNFQNRVIKERSEYIVRSAAEANMNMLRVWGGGIYEDDLFYDLCDKYGILIWQEMMFACAMYPANQDFIRNVRFEVIDNIVRIRNHACLAMYCGNNENDISWYQWKWKEKYDDAAQKKYEKQLHNLFYDVIPSAIREADSTRYYHPTSPIAGFNNVSNSEGDIHYWGVWHGNEPFEKYNSNIARFVSEYGFQSYPELQTVMKYTNPEDRQIHSDVMNSHQRCLADERRDKEYGNRLIQNYIDRWYRPPKNFESYLYISQVIQAEGVKIAMEAHRREMPFCMGSLYWQIDDCWPVASWSSIDYYGKWKALHYAAKKSFAPILISPVISENDMKIYIVSDRQKYFTGKLEITVMDFEGKMIMQKSIPVNIKANSSENMVTLRRQDISGQMDESGIVMMSNLFDDKEMLADNIFYFKLPKELKLTKPKYTTKINKTASGYELEMSVNTLAKNIYITSRDDKEFVNDNYFDMLPGMKKLITITTALSRADFEKNLSIISLVDSYE